MKLPGEKQFRTDLDEKVLANYLAVLRRIGLSQKEGVRRLMDMCNKSDPDLQAMMHELLTPERRAMLAKSMLQQMARGSKK